MSTIIPAGHQESTQKKSSVDETSELERCLIAARTTNGVRLPDNVSVAEAHAVVLGQTDTHLCGHFLNEAYRVTQEKVIVYDLDMSLNHIGAGLPADKLLINRGTTGNRFGYRTHGVVVNLGRTEYLYWPDSSGLLVNCGTVDSFGTGVAEEVRLFRGELYYHVPPVSQYQGAPSRSRHLQEVLEICKGPIEGIYDRYGETPAAAIKSALLDLRNEVQE